VKEDAGVSLSRYGSSRAMATPRTGKGKRVGAPCVTMEDLGAHQRLTAGTWPALGETSRPASRTCGT